MKKYFYLLAMLAVVLGTVACGDDDNHPGTNVLDTPEVSVPDVKGKLSRYYMEGSRKRNRLYLQSEQRKRTKHRPEHNSIDRFGTREKLHIQSESLKNRLALF